MREIRFRAYSTETNKMMDWDSIKRFGNLTKLIGLNHMRVMQYTGFKDKNGKEVYEGDIVNVWDWGYPPNNKLLSVSKVQWSDEDSGWWLNPDPTDGDRYDLFRNTEVIGNIYENENLIK